MTNMVSFISENYQPHRYTSPRTDNAIVPIPAFYGLSPMWRLEYCEIPVKANIKPKQAESITEQSNKHPLADDSMWPYFIGKQINVKGFAQGCTIEAIFRRKRYNGYRIIVEWAKLTHPRFGTVYRMTSQLYVKDVIC